jgi:putative membrane protein
MSALLAGFAAAVPARHLPAQSNGVASNNKHFVQTVAEASLFEVESGKLAAERSGNREVKGYAQQMIEDHTRMLADLAEVNDAARGWLPSTLGATYNDRLKKLKDAPEGGFEGLYMGMQVDLHARVLMLHRDFSRAGEDEKLRQFTANQVAMLNRHLEHARVIGLTLDRRAR